MEKVIKETIHANGIDIGIYTKDFENEFISLTDIARYKSDDPTAVIQNWMRNRDVIEFLGLWERLHNLDFNPLEFEGFRKQAGANSFTMSPKKWIDATGAIGIVVLCQDLVQVKMSFSHSNLPAIPKLPVDTIFQNHRVTYNRNDYEFAWYYKTFPSIQIPGGMHVCNC